MKQNSQAPATHTTAAFHFGTKPQMGIQLSLTCPHRRRLIQAIASAVALQCVVGCAGAASEPTVSLAKSRARARGRFPGKPVATKNKSAQTESLLSQVDASRLAATIAALAGFGTRWTYSKKIRQAEQWLREAFVSYGYAADAVRSVPFRMPNGNEPASVVCSPDSVDAGFILICAHYDSRSERPAQLAPGADDNASGIAVMLEVARLLRLVLPGRRVMYVAFAGEEQGLIGSEALARRAQEERWAIDALINLDMVGWIDPLRPSTLAIEFDQGNKDSGNDEASRYYGLRMAQAASDYTLLTVEHTDIWSSDYMPFEAIGIPCVGVYDGGADATFYHSVNDVAAIVSEERLVQVTRLLLAFVAEFAIFQKLSSKNIDDNDLTTIPASR